MARQRGSSASSWLLLGSRYLVTAGVAFIVYFAMLFVLFSVAHLPYVLAVGIAYVGTLAVHFSMNRAFTFRSGNTAVSRQLLRYGATALLNYCVQITIIYVLYSRCHIDFYLATLAGLIANLAIGFYLLHSWVFGTGAPGLGEGRSGS